MPVFLHSNDPELLRDKRATDYVVNNLTKKYSKSGAFAKTTRDDAKFNLFVGLLDQLESELTKFQTYYTEYETEPFEGAPSTRRKKKTSRKTAITEVRGEVGLGSIVGLVKRVARILDSYPTFNSLNPRDIATLTKSYQDLMVFVSGFQDLTDSSDDYRKRLEKAREDVENWEIEQNRYGEGDPEELAELEKFVQQARLQPPLRIQGVANAFYADLYNFLIAFRTKLNIYETDPENKTPSFGAKRPAVAGDGGDDDDGGDGENRGFDALMQEGAPRSALVAQYLRRPDVRGRLEAQREAPFPEPPRRVVPHGAFLDQPYFIEDLYEPEIPRRGRNPNVYSADVVLDSRVGKKQGVRTRSQGDFKDYVGDLERPLPTPRRRESSGDLSELIKGLKGYGERATFLGVDLEDTPRDPLAPRWGGVEQPKFRRDPSTSGEDIRGLYPYLEGKPPTKLQERKAKSLAKPKGRPVPKTNPPRRQVGRYDEEQPKVRQAPKPRGKARPKPSLDDARGVRF